jgi:hypothetical protein
VRPTLRQRRQAPFQVDLAHGAETDVPRLQMVDALGSG